MPFDPSTQSGSSPRMRGALYRVAANESWFRIIPADAGSPRLPESGLPLLGIIPADAGSTEAAGVGPDELEDHPRGCGEHGLKSKFVTNPGGSSPRMRGALCLIGHERVDQEIIPADAGSTDRFGFPQFGSKGSSPRMRGALRLLYYLHSLRRIIPADAGSTR